MASVALDRLVESVARRSRLPRDLIVFLDTIVDCIGRGGATCE
jgi:hypothetical protein